MRHIAFFTLFLSHLDNLCVYFNTFTLVNQVLSLDTLDGPFCLNFPQINLGFLRDDSDNFGLGVIL